MIRLMMGVLCLVLSVCSISAETEQEFIEHSGDRYVFNVEAMNPDKEMTLMDVLQMCPELLSSNGKRITALYEIRIDNVTLALDDETVLEALKACEISTIEVYLSSAVAVSGSAGSNIIDIYLKDQEDGKTSGKVLLEGSTKGNGKAWTNVTTRSGNVTLRGYALTNLEYGRGKLRQDGRYSSRQGTENVHLNVNWDISENDNLVVKLFQNYLDSKQRFYRSEHDADVAARYRHWMATASYTRTLSEQGASLLAEGGGEFLSTSVEDIRQQNVFAYYFTEANLPLGNALNTLVGWEIDYFNTWTHQVDRQQMMFNDLYLQLDYTKGPWVLTVGDRLRFINYWHRTYHGPDASLWNHHRTENSILASAGFKTGGHFVQALFNRDYNTPTLDYIYGGYDDGTRRGYNTGLPTNWYHCIEARYTYQQKDFVVTGGLLHSWSDDSPLFDERYTGVKASVTWRNGPLRITAGVDFFHWETDGIEYEGEPHYNYFNLRLLPSLLLDGGWRISSRLLYNSRRNLLEYMPAHLYASVKVSKDLGSHCTVSADFHDLAGPSRIPDYLAGYSYDNRALTLGFTYRF